MATQATFQDSDNQSPDEKILEGQNKLSVDTSEESKNSCKDKKLSPKPEETKVCSNIYDEQVNECPVVVVGNNAS